MVLCQELNDLMASNKNFARMRAEQERIQESECKLFANAKKVSNTK